MTADTDALWKRRFGLFSLARLVGIALIGAGFYIAFSGLVTPGGAPKLGGLLIALGTIEAVVVPQILKARWKLDQAPTPDQEN